MDLKSMIRDIPDFPQAGVLFRDITPLLKSQEALDHVARSFAEKLDLKQVDYFAGIESRGFILAMLLAAKHGKGFLPLRKSGKLPPPVLSESYALEYGKATLEVNPGQGRLIILDDVLATGGTLNASIKLCEKAGYEVKDVGVLINLKFLNQMTFRGRNICSLVDYH